MDNPVITVIAGPAGSGKSTVTGGYPFPGVYVNADDIKRFRRCSDIEAEHEAELVKGNLLNMQKDFTYETAFSAESDLVFLEIAKNVGYSVESIFVLTADPELNVKRIKSHVLKGGFDVIKDKNHSKHKKSLQLLKRLVALSNICVVIDNTGVPDVIFKKDSDEEIYLSNDFWNEDEIKELVYTYTRQ